MQKLCHNSKLHSSPAIAFHTHRAKPLQQEIGAKVGMTAGQSDDKKEFAFIKPSCPRLATASPLQLDPEQYHP